MPVASPESLLEEYGLVAAEDFTAAAGVGTTAFYTRYRSWDAADGLGAKVAAFVDGAGNFLAAMGLPRAWGTALMALLVASFAATTLDTAVRLQRYVVEELLSSLKRPSQSPDRQGGVSGSPPTPDPSLTVGALSGSLMGAVWRSPLARARTHLATLIAVITAAALAALPASGVWSLENVGTGGLILWPLFGASNQLLAGLAFMVILFYLRRRRMLTWFLIPPMLFMLIVPAWAMMVQVPGWWADSRYVLVALGVACLGLEVWMVIEGALLYGRVKGMPEGTAGVDRPHGFEVVRGGGD